MATPEGAKPADRAVNLAIELFHETSGNEGVCGLKVARSGYPTEVARLHVSLEAYTQRVMYHLFADQGKLYEYETSMLAIGALRPGDIAIDVGAHVGYFSLLFRLLVGENGSVYAFEPMPDTYNRLLRNVMLNRFTNVMPLPMALATWTGSAEFHFNADNEGECTLVADVGDGSCQVRVTKLDDIFENALPARPRLLKIDAEGAEMHVLEGGFRWFDEQAPDMVICEINRIALQAAGTSETEIREFMQARDYRCAVINIAGVDMGVSGCGARFYRYLAADEPAAPNSNCVFNLMFVRNGSDLYPDEYL